jgi:hypothetical protein
MWAHGSCSGRWSEQEGNGGDSELHPPSQGVGGDWETLETSCKLESLKVRRLEVRLVKICCRSWGFRFSCDSNWCCELEGKSCDASDAATSSWHWDLSNSTRTLLPSLRWDIFIREYYGTLTPTLTLEQLQLCNALNTQFRFRGAHSSSHHQQCGERVWKS